jgi:hypothetical protein
MNRENFVKYLSDFSSLNSQSLEEIKFLLEEFPYFQSGWILYAKNLHLLKDVRFENKLKVAATYIPDRKVLSRLLKSSYQPFANSETISNPEKITSVEKTEQAKITDFNNSEDNAKTIVDETKKLPKEEFTVESDNNTELEPNLETDSKETDLYKIIAERLSEINDRKNTPKKTTSESTTKINEEVPSEIIDLSQIINPTVSKNYDTKQTIISSEELLNFNFDTDNPEEKLIEKKLQNTNLSKTELIDKFLDLNPRIIPDRDYISNSDLPRDSMILQDEELFSETLAKIYIKQEHFDKALLTYEKLCLKYPEKNIYFASQINKIEELIKNKKN